MAKVCPLAGCKEKKICVHDWMMIIVVVAVAGFIAGRTLGLF